MISMITKNRLKISLFTFKIMYFHLKSIRRLVNLSLKKGHIVLLPPTPSHEPRNSLPITQLHPHLHSHSTLSFPFSIPLLKRKPTTSNSITSLLGRTIRHRKKRAGKTESVHQPPHPPPPAPALSVGEMFLLYSRQRLVHMHEREAERERETV